VEEKELRYGTDNKNEIPAVCDEQLVPSFVPGRLSHKNYPSARNNYTRTCRNEGIPMFLLDIRCTFPLIFEIRVCHKKLDYGGFRA